jgi:hypothetical protein
MSSRTPTWVSALLHTKCPYSEHLTYPDPIRSTRLSKIGRLAASYIVDMSPFCCEVRTDARDVWPRWSSDHTSLSDVGKIDHLLFNLGFLRTFPFRILAAFGVALSADTPSLPIFDTALIVIVIAE